MIRDSGWNTWDFRRLAAFSFLEEKRERLSVRISFLDELERRRISEFTWRDLVRPGPHATDGSYGEIEIQAGFEARFRIRAHAEGKKLVILIDPTRISGKRPVVELAEPGTFGAKRRKNVLKGGSWGARAAGAIPEGRVFVAAEHPCFVGRRGQRLAVTCSLDEVAPPDPEIAEEILASARESWEKRSLRGEGTLSGAPEAMMAAVAWNTVYDPGGRGIVTTVSREWSRNWKSVVLFGWDTLFLAVSAALEDPELGYLNLQALLRGATEEGFVPNWRLSNGAATLDRSQPPVGGLALARLTATALDRERLRDLLPRLLRWHDWWNRARDGNGDGLLEWGSSPQPVFSFPELKQILRNEAVCGAYESGMDNSPLFDGVSFDREKGVLREADVGLNSLHAADAGELASLFRLAGDRNTAARLEEEAARRCALIRERLWDPRRRTFANRSWSGRFHPSIAPTSFYPLLCGAASPRQVEECIESQFKDPHGFHGEWILPSVRRDDPAFRDQDYWRGRVWPPVNFLVAEAFRRAGRLKEAREVAASGLAMFLHAWRNESRIYENYSALTGEGGDVPNADPFYAWGGLLAYTAVQEIFNAEPDRSLSFGTGKAEETGIRNLKLAGERWNVLSGPQGLLVEKDGRAIIESDRPSRVSGYHAFESSKEIRIDAEPGTRIRIREGLERNSEIVLVLPTGKKRVRSDGKGGVEFTA